MSFGGLYISMSGIYANKKALDTVSHNITNVNNPNYVRQNAIHATNIYNNSPDGRFQLGKGVQVQEIRQIRDEFLDIQFRRESEFYGYWKANSEIYGEVEVIFNEITSSGLNDVMKDFWNNWSELYKEPDSLTIRGLVHESAVAFTETANHISNQLDQLQRNLNKEIINKVEEINNILSEVAKLNYNIKLTEGYGHHVKANDYRDMRNAKLDRFSELLPIKCYEKCNSEVVVSLFGRDLINGDYFNPMKIEYNKKGFGEIHWSDTGEPIDLQGRGELGGYIDARDTIVEEYRERLDIFVSTIAKEVNDLHRKGKDLRWDAKNPTKNEINFFIPEDENNIDAATIRINPEFIELDKIAVSRSGEIGDGEIAKEILALRTKTLFYDYKDYYDENGELKDIEIGKYEEKSLDADDFYRDIVTSIGVGRNKARGIEANQKRLLEQINGRRKSLSDVSLDEEMAFMLQYQHSYIANSRVVNAIDEMVETVVTRMGIVGR